MDLAAFSVSRTRSHTTDGGSIRERRFGEGSTCQYSDLDAKHANDVMEVAQRSSILRTAERGRAGS